MNKIKKGLIDSSLKRLQETGVGSCFQDIVAGKQINIHKPLQGRTNRNDQ